MKKILMWLFGIPYEKPEIVDFKIKPKMSDSGRICIDKDPLNYHIRCDARRSEIDRLVRMRRLREKAAVLRSGK